MRWLTVAGVLLYLTRCNDAGALKCHPGSQDPLCALEKKEISPIQNLIERNIESADDAQCEPGSEWESNCHRCHCSESGFSQCTKLYSCIAEKLADPIPCRPNTMFNVAGSTCLCLENGLGLCTLQSHTIDKRSPEQQCTPGSTFKISCNTCTCLADGSASCTKRGCLDRPISVKQKREIPNTLKSWRHLRVKRSVCKPNSEFNVDCNPCKCAANGLSYSCTHNECLEGDNTNKEVEVFMETEGTDHVEQHSVCKPRATFYVGCNTCRCNFQGTDYSCTNKPCPLPEDVELFHELKVQSLPTPPAKPANSTKVVCVANRMFIKDCNTCWCNEDGTSYFCTRRVCIEMPDDAKDPNQELKLRVVKKECKPNEVFEMDCNMCRCNADGNSFSCTRRACFDTDDKNVTSRSIRSASPETPKTCQPGQEFRRDCNKCLCNDEGHDFSCTRIDCTALNNGGTASFASTRRKRDTTVKTEEKCVPGSVFDRSCNVCRCSADGLHATCTLKRCQKADATAVTTDASPAFRCTPGDQFRRDCNDCTCSADGKMEFCTIRLCDDVPDLAP